MGKEIKNNENLISRDFPDIPMKENTIDYNLHDPVEFIDGDSKASKKLNSLELQLDEAHSIQEDFQESRSSNNRQKNQTLTLARNLRDKYQSAILDLNQVQSMSDSLINEIDQFESFKNHISNELTKVLQSIAGDNYSDYKADDDRLTLSHFNELISRVQEELQKKLFLEKAEKDRSNIVICKLKTLVEKAYKSHQENKEKLHNLELVSAEKERKHSDTLRRLKNALNTVDHHKGNETKLNKEILTSRKKISSLINSTKILVDKVNKKNQQIKSLHAQLTVADSRIDYSMIKEELGKLQLINRELELNLKRSQEKLSEKDELLLEMKLKVKELEIAKKDSLSKISQIKMEIEWKDGQLKEVLAKSNRVQESKKLVSQELKQFQTEYHRLNQLLRENQAEHQDLRAEYKTIERQLAESQSKNGYLLKEIDLLKVKEEELKKEIQRQSDRVSELFQNYKSEQEQGFRYRDEIESLNLLLREIKIESEGRYDRESRKKIDELKGQIQTLNQEKENLEKAHKEWLFEESQLKASLKEMTAKFDGKVLDYESLYLETHGSESKFQELSEINRKLLLENNEVHRALERTKSELSARSSELSQLATQYESLRRSLDSGMILDFEVVSKELFRLSKKIHLLEKSVENTEFRSNSQKIKNLEKFEIQRVRIESLQKELAEATSVVNSLRERESDHAVNMDRIKILEAELRELRLSERRHEKSKSRLEALEQFVTHLKEENASLKNSIGGRGDLHNQIGGLEEVLRQKEQMIDSLSEAVKLKDGTIQSLNRKATQLKESLKKEQDDLKHYLRVSADSTEEIQLRESEIKALQKMVVDLQERVDKAKHGEKRILWLESSINELNMSNKLLKEQIKKKNNEVGPVESAKEELKRMEQSLKDRESEIHKRDTEIQKKDAVIEG
ncbi:MAG: hypothetical protein KDD61_10220, partial [Bdellovibrionales bacterium]|nr:hypothetical protein [Bdellovibrionales bacterium]